jgi:hypothetical protein
VKTLVNGFFDSNVVEEPKGFTKVESGEVMKGFAGAAAVPSGGFREGEAAKGFAVTSFANGLSGDTRGDESLAESTKGLDSRVDDQSLELSDRSISGSCEKGLDTPAKGLTSEISDCRFSMAGVLLDIYKREGRAKEDNEIVKMSRKLKYPLRYPLQNVLLLQFLDREQHFFRFY